MVDESEIQGLINQVADDLAWPFHYLRFRSYEDGPAFEPRLTSFGIRRDVLDQLDLDEIEFFVRLRLGHGQFMPRPAPITGDLEDGLLALTLRKPSPQYRAYRRRYARSSEPRREMSRALARDSLVRLVLVAFALAQIPILAIALRGSAGVALAADLVLCALAGLQVASERWDIANRIVTQQACEACGFPVAYSFVAKARQFRTHRRFHSDFVPNLERAIRDAEISRPSQGVVNRCDGPTNPPVV